jgi:hypothetical protein
MINFLLGGVELIAFLVILYLAMMGLSNLFSR